MDQDSACQMEQPVSGLAVCSAWADTAIEAVLLAHIDAMPWRNDLKRRVQHYGYRYDYRARSASAEDRLGPLPEWLMPFCERLVDEGHFAARPDQVIVNEYMPGQGISAHVDCVPCFGPVIASLSLGGAAVMQFEEPQSGEVRDILLEPGSLLVLSGPARRRWRHAIPARKSDVVGGVRVSRSRRISLTFRTVRF